MKKVYLFLLLLLPIGLWADPYGFLYIATPVATHIIGKPVHIYWYGSLSGSAGRFIERQDNRAIIDVNSVPSSDGNTLTGTNKIITWDIPEGPFSVTKTVIFMASGYGYYGDIFPGSSGGTSLAGVTVFQNAYAATATATRTSTPTVTPTITLTPTITPVMTPTKVPIWYYTTLCVANGSVLINGASGTVTVNVSTYTPYLLDGYIVIPSRDYIHTNSKVIVSNKTSTSFDLSIINRTTKVPIDCSYQGVNVIYNVMRKPK